MSNSAITAEIAADIVQSLAQGLAPARVGWREDLEIWRTSRAQGPFYGSHGTDPIGRADLACNAPNPSGCDVGEHMTGFSLWLELVEDCNLDCLFCYNPWRPTFSRKDKAATIAKGDLVRAVDYIAGKLEINHITLSGGEPLLYAELISLTHELREASRSIGMTTNGRAATRSRIAALRTAGLSQISVPLHSHNEAVHDQLAGGRSWRAAIRALAVGLELGLRMTLTCVVTKKNIDDIADVGRIAHYLGIGTVVLNCFHSTGQGAAHDDLGVSRTTFEEIVDSVRTALEGDAQVLVGAPPPGSGTAVKDKVNRITISPTGEIKLCGQSERGVLSLQDSPEALDALLEALRDGRYSEYTALVDSCSCLNKQAP